MTAAVRVPIAAGLKVTPIAQLAPAATEMSQRMRPEGGDDLEAAGIIDSIIGAVREHAGTAPQADDMTIVVIKRL